jgi:hypothetical protein
MPPPHVVVVGGLASLVPSIRAGDRSDIPALDRSQGLSARRLLARANGRRAYGRTDNERCTGRRPRNQPGSVRCERGEPGAPEASPRRTSKSAPRRQISRLQKHPLLDRLLKKVQLQGGAPGTCPPGWVKARGVLSPYAAAPRERGNAADGPFSAACQRTQRRRMLARLTANRAAQNSRSSRKSRTR